MSIIPEILIINFGKGASRTGSRSTAGEEKLANGGSVEGFERKRRDSEEERERFWRKKAVSRVWLAYRELIGSLYESWTIGIERVYKWLINIIIQQR